MCIQKVFYTTLQIPLYIYTFGLTSKSLCCADDPIIIQYPRFCHLKILRTCHLFPCVWSKGVHYDYNSPKIIKGFCIKYPVDTLVFQWNSFCFHPESPVLSSGYVSDSSSFKLVYDDEHSPVLVYEPKDLSERDYTESLEWICKEDTCPTSRDEVYPFLDYPTPMYGPLCVSYAVPPASMPDTKNIDDLPVYIQTYQLNGEQW